VLVVKSGLGIEPQETNKEDKQNVKNKRFANTPIFIFFLLYQSTMHSSNHTVAITRQIREKTNFVIVPQTEKMKQAILEFLSFFKKDLNGANLMLGCAPPSATNPKFPCHAPI
jgi:hypothetical protein